MLHGHAHICNRMCPKNPTSLKRIYAISTAVYKKAVVYVVSVERWINRMRFGDKSTKWAIRYILTVQSHVLWCMWLCNQCPDLACVFPLRYHGVWCYSRRRKCFTLGWAISASPNAIHFSFMPVTTCRLYRAWRQRFVGFCRGFLVCTLSSLSSVLLCCYLYSLSSSASLPLLSTVILNTYVFIEYQLRIYQRSLGLYQVLHFNWYAQQKVIFESRQ